MVGVAFLVVYREGAETTLFYQALLQQGAAAAPAVLGGFVVGSAALAAVYVLFHRFGVRMPLRQFFAVTGTLLYVMAMVFAGKGVRELQEGGILQTTPIGWLPRLDALGVYPSVETFAAPWLLLGVFVLAVWHTFITQRVRGSRRSPGVPGPSSGAATSTALQPPRTPARTSAPS